MVAVQPAPLLHFRQETSALDFTLKRERRHIVIEDVFDCPPTAGGRIYISNTGAIPAPKNSTGSERRGQERQARSPFPLDDAGPLVARPVDTGGAGPVHTGGAGPVHTATEDEPVSATGGGLQARWGR